MLRLPGRPEFGGREGFRTGGGSAPVYSPARYRFPNRIFWSTDFRVLSASAVAGGKEGAYKVAGEDQEKDGLL
jgi:hypothetical protein